MAPKLCYKGEWDALSLLGAPLRPSLPLLLPSLRVEEACTSSTLRVPMRFSHRGAMGSSLPPDPDFLLFL